MSTTRVQAGKNLEWTNSTGSDVSSGDPVVVGGILTVAEVDIDNGESGNVTTEEVHSLSAVAAESWSQGDELFFDDRQDKLTQIPFGNTRAGVAAADKAAAATTADVKLNVPGFKDPHNFCEMDDDFMDASISETADAARWLATLVDGDSDEGEVLGIADDSAGGQLTCTTNDKDNDLNNLQWNGEAFKLQAGKPLVFEALGVAVDDVDTMDLFIGLCITDATAIAGATDCVGFRIADGTASVVLECVSEKDSTEESTTDTDATLADATEVDLRIVFDGGSSPSILFYVDDTLVATHSTTVPDDEFLTPTLEIRNASAAASTLSVDRVRCWQMR
jgi:predicted RecA/RadA family phage recombinase